MLAQVEAAKNTEIDGLRDRQGRREKGRTRVSWSLQQVTEERQAAKVSRDIAYLFCINCTYFLIASSFGYHHFLYEFLKVDSIFPPVRSLPFFLVPFDWLMFMLICCCWSCALLSVRPLTRLLSISRRKIWKCRASICSEFTKRQKLARWACLSIRYILFLLLVLFQSNSHFCCLSTSL